MKQETLERLRSLPGCKGVAVWQEAAELTRRTAGYRWVEKGLNGVAVSTKERGHIARRGERFEEIMSETQRPKRTGRSMGAVVAGAVTGIILSIGTDADYRA